MVNKGVLSALGSTDVETYVDCIKGKQTNKSKKGERRSSNLLEIIQTDICCIDMDLSGLKYFITFIDDYSQYMYLYILHSKYEALDAFKDFKNEVEKQCGKQIKIMRFDRGGEYYSRCAENGQVPSLFVKFLQEHEIVVQYPMPSSLDQNGVIKRRNQTLMDMVRSNRKLPQFFRIEALKTIVYILNRVSTKAISKTTFELFKGWKPSLRHIRIWGCPFEVKIYNRQEKKNYTQGLSVGISLDMSKSPKGIDSIVHHITLGL